MSRKSWVKKGPIAGLTQEDLEFADQAKADIIIVTSETALPYMPALDALLEAEMERRRLAALDSREQA